MKDPSLCKQSRCTNKHGKSRKDCPTCNKRKWRAKYPMKASYAANKFNSKRRGIFNDLTFEQFRKFCIRTDYMAGKGRSKESYSIDRIIEGPLPGYTYSNIQKLSVSENSRKEQRRRKRMLVYDYKTKYARVI